jgi:phosphoribosylglycinamide formyltransferase 1
MSPSYIAIFASGSGTNAEHIIKYFQKHPRIRVSIVLTNNPKAGVIDRAKKHEVPTVIFSREEFRDAGSILHLLKQQHVTHIVLAGFLWMVPNYLIREYSGKIINIHPALLPKHGGKGMYGLKVHEAVKAAAEKETGITIHLVNEHYDEGEIVFQARCPIEETFSAEEIQKCVHRLEYEHYPRVIKQWIGSGV